MSFVPLLIKERRTDRWMDGWLVGTEGEQFLWVLLPMKVPIFAIRLPINHRNKTSIKNTNRSIDRRCRDRPLNLLVLVFHRQRLWPRLIKILWTVSRHVVAGAAIRGGGQNMNWVRNGIVRIIDRSINYSVALFATNNWFTNMPEPVTPIIIRTKWGFLASQGEE